MPLITVIVPVYNTEEYLKRCVDSLLGQSCKNVELILIDDGSTDTSGEICDDYAKMDARVRVIHSENRGVSYARNLGIEAAKGEYITFADSDDYAAPDLLSCLYEMISLHNAQISICGHYRAEDQRITPSYPNQMELVMTTETALRNLLHGELYHDYMWAKLYKANLFSGIRFPEGVNYEDIAIQCRVLSKAEKIVYNSSPKYYYVQRGDSLTHEPFSVRQMDFITALEHVRDFICNNHPSLAKSAYYKYLIGNLWFANQLASQNLTGQFSAEYAILSGNVRRYVRQIRPNPFIRTIYKAELILLGLMPAYYKKFYQKYAGIKERRDIIEKS